MCVCVCVCEVQTGMISLSRNIWQPYTHTHTSLPSNYTTIACNGYTLQLQKRDIQENNTQGITHSGHTEILSKRAIRLWFYNKEEREKDGGRKGKKSGRSSYFV